MLGRTMLAGTVMALAAACGDDAVPGTAPGDELTRDQMDAVARQLQVQCEQEHPGPDATALCTCIVMSVAHGQDRADATDYCGRPQMLKMMRSLGRATDAVGGGGGHHQGAAEPEGPSRTIVAEALGVPMPPGTHQLVAEGSGGSDGVETRAVWLVATAPCDTVVETLRERFGADLDVSNRARIPVTESVVVGVHEPGDARWEPPAGEPPAGVRCGVVVRPGSCTLVSLMHCWTTAGLGGLLLLTSCGGGQSRVAGPEPGDDVWDGIDDQEEPDRAFVPVDGWRDISLSLRVLPPSPLLAEVQAMLGASQMMDAHAHAVSEARRIEAEHGPDSPEHADALTVVAHTQVAAGQLNRAIETNASAMRIHAEVFGDNDPRTLMVRFAQSHLILQAGRPGDAISMVESLRQPVEDAFGRESEHYASVLGAIGILRMRVNQPAVALPALEEALRIAAARFPPNAPMLSGLRVELATAAWHLSQLDRAQQLLDELFARPPNASGADDVPRVRGRMMLARVLLARGDLAAAGREAAVAEQAAVRLEARAPAVMAPIVAEARSTRGSTMLGGARTLEGLALMQRAHESLAASQPQSPLVHELRFAHAVQLSNVGFMLRAATEMEQLRSVGAQAVGEGAQALLPAEVARAKVILFAGRVNEAQRLLAALLPRAESAAVTQRGMLIETLVLMGDAAILRGDYAGAVRRWDRALGEVRRVAPQAPRIPRLLAKRIMARRLAGHSGLAEAERELARDLSSRRDGGLAAGTAHILIARSELRRMRLQPAEQAARSALSALEESPNTLAWRVEAHATLAVALTEQSRRADAARALAAVESHCGPRLAPALAPCAEVAALGRRLGRHGDPIQSSLAHVRSVSDVLPPHHHSVVQAVHHLARAGLESGRPGDVIGALDAWAASVHDVVSRQPSVARGLVGRVQVLAALGRSDDARRAADAVRRVLRVEMATEHPDARQLERTMTEALGGS